MNLISEVVLAASKSDGFGGPLGIYRIQQQQIQVQTEMPYKCRWRWWLPSLDLLCRARQGGDLPVAAVQRTGTQRGRGVGAEEPGGAEVGGGNGELPGDDVELRSPAELWSPVGSGRELRSPPGGAELSSPARRLTAQRRFGGTVERGRWPVAGRRRQAGRSCEGVCRATLFFFLRLASGGGVVCVRGEECGGFWGSCSECPAGGR